MAKTAIVLGATGATGHELVKLLLADSRYTTVKLFSRSASAFADPKIEEHIVNLFELDKYAAGFTGDVVFCCIGTTKAQTPDKTTYRNIEFGIPTAAAKLAKQNRIPSFIVMSALGADKNSRIFYSRNKGEMQEEVISTGIPNTHVLQPSLIVAQRKEFRLGEKIADSVMTLLNPILWGGMAKYKSITASAIARAMVWLDNNRYDKIIVPSDELAAIAKK